MAAALGAIGDPAAAPALLDVFKEPDKIPRRGRRPGLGESGQRHLQLQVVRALGRIADARAKDALKKMTKNPEVLAAKALKLATLYIASERFKPAARTLREIIKKWPKTAAAQEARTLLMTIE